MTDPKQHSNSLTTLTQRLDINFVLQMVGTGLWDYDLMQKQVWWDDRCQQMFGFQQEDIVSYQHVLQCIHPDDRQHVDQAINWTINPQSKGHFDHQFRTVGASDGQLRWLHCRGQAFFNEQGEAYRFSGIAHQVTQPVDAHQQLDRTQSVFGNFVMATPTATAVFVGRDMIIQQVNAAMLAIWGKDASVINKPLHLALPEQEGQPFLAQLQHVFDSGESFRYPEGVTELIENGKPKRVYFSYAYNPLFDQHNQIYGVINTATDITAQVVARQQLSDSHRLSDNLFNNTVAAQSMMVGEQMRLSQVNGKMLELWGRDHSILGKPLMEALPELVDTPLTQRLQHVYTTGEPYHQPEERFDLLRYGQPYTGYYRYTYEPLYSSQNQIYGIICTTVEITQEVLARQKAQDSEARLRSLVEEAPIATGLFVGREMRIEIANEPMINIWGKGRTVFGKSLAEALPELVGQPFLAILDAVFTTGETYEAKASRAELEVDGVLGSYYFDFTYKPLRDAGGQVYAILDMAIDVTAQVVAHQALEASETRYRQLAGHLEEQVQERTEQLAASNEELAATNEQLAATNDDMVTSNQALETANTDLLRSNQNLEQFAYVASHDMQEPLRKIQQFGDLLQSQYGDQLGEGTTYLERMQVAASRMSVLIKDLLAFSRIATTQVIAQPVPLNQVVNSVLETLSFVMQESGAQVEVTRLPVVSGDRSQLDQLFQNLLSNALKFRRSSQTGEVVTPQISVEASVVPLSQLPPLVVPSRYAQGYHRIEVVDNGIGFDEKYTDRIFQVFQRLHGKNEFAGTGIGLAIVQKVVTNHGGAITAKSQPGQGAIFTIYLPMA